MLKKNSFGQNPCSKIGNEINCAPFSLIKAYISELREEGGLTPLARILTFANNQQVLPFPKSRGTFCLLNSHLPCGY